MVPIFELDTGERVIVNKATVGIKGQDVYVRGTPKAIEALTGSASIVSVQRRPGDRLNSLRKGNEPVGRGEKIKFNRAPEVHR